MLNLTGLALTPGAQRSWWLREALGQEQPRPCPPLDADVKADVVIVGGGFTGLWTAYFLTERNPDLGVVVLEQDICGGGERLCEEMVELARDVGAADELRELTAAEVKARCSSPAFRGGAFMRDGASVQPALLVRGLRRVLLERGVTIHEGTAVTGLDGTDAITTRGRVQATPFRSWGAAAVRRAMIAKETAEERGTEPNFLVSQLSRTPRRLGYLLGPD